MSGYISLVLVILDFSAESREENEVFIISHTDDYSPKIEKSLPNVQISLLLKTFFNNKNHDGTGNTLMKKPEKMLLSIVVFEFEKNCLISTDLSL